jgi:hypothetical protein
MQPPRAAVFPATLFGCLFVVMIGLFATPQIEMTHLLSGTNVVHAENSPPSEQEDYAHQSAPADEIREEESLDISGNASCLISQYYPVAISRWCNLITHHARENQLDPNLVAAVMLQESGGDPTAISKSGAVGLLQVMPSDGIAADFVCINGPCFASRPTTLELEDPDFNIGYGTRLLASLITYWGNQREGLFHYGPIGMGYHYADTVLAIYQRYQ